MDYHVKQELIDTAGSTSIMLLATVLLYSLVPNTGAFVFMMLGACVGNVLYGIGKAVWKHYKHKAEGHVCKWH